MKKYTVKKNYEIKRAMKYGKYKVGENITLYKLTTKNQFSRFAACVSKKNGNSVERNRLKRWIRESVYKYIDFSDIADYIVVAKKNIIVENIKYRDIEKDIIEAVEWLKK